MAEGQQQKDAGAGKAQAVEQAGKTAGPEVGGAARRSQSKGAESGRPLRTTGNGGCWASKGFRRGCARRRPASGCSAIQRMAGAVEADAPGVLDGGGEFRRRLGWVIMSAR